MKKKKKKKRWRAACKLKFHEDARGSKYWPTHTDTAIFLLEEYYEVALPLSEKNGYAYWMYVNCKCDKA